MPDAMLPFATIIPPAESSGDSCQNGLRVANAGFLQGLVRYGEFPEFHFFVIAADCLEVEAFWSRFQTLEGLEKEIRVYPLHLLPVCLSQHHYSVFHCGDHYIAHLLELREAYAERLFPITGRAHSLCQDVSLSATRNVYMAPQKCCDAVLCASDAAHKSMNMLFRAVLAQMADRHCLAITETLRIEKLPLGIETADFPVIDKTHARQELGLPEEGIIILYLGRIDPGNKMDLHPLILALDEVINHETVGDGRDIILYICGQASASDDYVVSLSRTAGQLVIEDQVLFRFDLEHDERNTVYSAADIFVSIADNPQETFGIAPLEAMAAGLPVVLSDWDGYRDLVENGRSGFLIPTLWGDVDALIAPTAYYEPERNLLAAGQSVVVDVSALSQALVSLIKDRKKREKIGTAGQQRVQERFTWTVSVSRYMALVKELGQIADTIDFQPSGGYPGLAPVAFFGHYASQQLGDDAVIKTLPRGRRALAGSEPPACFDGISHLVDAQLQAAVLEAALLGARVDQICAHIPLARPLVIFNILWGLKHHLLGRSTGEHTILLKRYVQLPPSRMATASHPDDAVWLVLQSTEYPNTWCSGLIQPVINMYLWPLLSRMLAASHWQIDDVVPTLTAPLVERLCQQLDQVWTVCQKSALRIDVEKLSAQALLDHFPLWGRQVKALLVAYLQATKALLQRLNNDWQWLCKEFLPTQSPEILRIISVEPLSDTHFMGTTLVRFSNGDTILHKPRDLRLEALLVNRCRDNESLSLAELFNQWVDDIVIGCLRQVARVETRRGRECHYGYTEYLEIDTPRSQWTEQCYRRIGLLSAFLLMTGQGDAHHKNILVQNEIPYPVDMKRSFSQRVVTALGDDLEQTAPLIWENCSLAKTRISLFWEAFDEITNNACRHSQYTSFVAKGFRQGLQLIIDKASQLIGVLQQMADLPARCTLLTAHQHRQQIMEVSTLHVFSESLLDTLYQTTRTMAVRFIREEGKVAVHGEPVSRHGDCFIHAWMRGSIPCFHRTSGSTALLLAPNDRPDRNIMLDPEYFTEPVLTELIQVIKRLDPKAVDKIAEVFENWLLGLAVDEPLEANLLQWLAERE